MNTKTEHFFSIDNSSQFEERALAIFRYQANHCLIYHEYIKQLDINAHQIKSYTEIPFLPISFFKTQDIVSSDKNPDIIFTSSGTTGHVTSKHLVQDVSIYEKSYNMAFERFYGAPDDYCILALLPSYLEREGSSLIYMVDDLLKKSRHPQSGYFLHNHEELFSTLEELNKNHQKTILIGVTYALLDFVERYTIQFPNLIVMETGGMKGKRREMVRQELHHILCNGFGVGSIHSEYGMTELLSQAYSYGNGIFNCPPWMKILLRDTSDPLSLIKNNQTGGINVIDLANINSCSFIATQDLGKIHSNNSFEVIGRFDNADIRGCNLLVQ
ncbi:acyl transferase [Pedobacter sp. ASV28]|uniref:LuxE/PaaK family acyltransferase n=1 Tax=Pedobacter sp. ASV28 TaxID=2795123 RepID=UPI0018EACF4B